MIHAFSPFDPALLASFLRKGEDGLWYDTGDKVAGTF